MSKTQCKKLKVVLTLLWLFELQLEPVYYSYSNSSNFPLINKGIAVKPQLHVVASVA